MAGISQARTPKRNGKTLRARMANIRRELAGLGAVNGGNDQFSSATEQLDALAGELAETADRLMTAGETIQDAADAIGARTKERATRKHLKRIRSGTGALFEACSFQDITGQRISKISRAVGAIEDGFQSVAALAGGKGALAAGKARAIDRVDGGIVLEGPQIDGPQVSQAEIDKLFD